MANRYVGRFAPSPSGPLHFGSLIAAVGSYLQAKSQHGQWLVRIEDIDPPREVAGASQLILSTLEQFGLYWDQDVIYQSQRTQAYDEAIALLNDKDLTYYCRCTRKQIQSQGHFYQGQCRDKQYPPENAALRIKTTTAITAFTDILHGEIKIDEGLAAEDFIIHRKDGLYAYNLAVVVDDISQGITEIVRGADLIDPTGRQLYLYQQFNQPAPSYLHLPLVSNADGNKLSKQNHAPALNSRNAKPLLINAFEFLGLPTSPELQDLSLEALLSWAVSRWSVQKIPQMKSIVLANTPD